VSAGLVAAATILVPVLGAALIAALGRWPNLREAATLVTAAALLALVVRLFPVAYSGARPELTVLQLLPGIALALQVEPLGVLFAFVASALWVVTSVYSIGYMRGHHEEHQTRFYVFFALALASSMGVAFAANLVTLFVFYEALTLTTFPLVTHEGTEEARRAGRIYLGVLFTTSIGLLLLAIVWTYALAGTLDFVPGGILAGKASPFMTGVLLALYVFGIGKAAVMPFHRWLPSAMVAPTPVSALLHAVAVVKAGVFTILKVTVYIFGIDVLHRLGSSVWLMYVAAATILLASLVALRKDNLKERLAYSTISQLSYIVLGAMLANRWGIIGGGLHIVMHAFGKITLFFCAGAIMVATGRTEVSEMRGLGRRMPITFSAFFIGALSVVGLPPTGGLWSKWYLALGTLEAHQLVLLAVLMFSSLLNLGYLMVVPVRAFFAAPLDDASSQAGQAPAGIREGPWPCVLALGVTAAGTIALFLYPGPFYRLLTMVVGQ
jgi:multicomponent Na+:H+ antiporter subunit D